MSKQNFDDEKIAIIGMSCRFPGANNIDEFWQVLLEGKDVIGEIPPHRWDVDKYYDPHPGLPNKMYTKAGGFIPDYESFDATFFSLSKRQASLMDPQQRMLLELSWHAIENAGYAAERLMGSSTGVFLAMGSVDYAVAQVFSDCARIDSYFLISNDMSFSANRIANYFNFTGLGFTINCACSSALVAINIARNKLISDEIDMALVGGINYIGAPFNSIGLSQAWLLAQDGRCKSFDASADGYVRSEGGGMVILKKLSKALKDHDNILAVIAGSAVNMDGARNSLVIPNEKGRIEVIKKALKYARCKPGDIDFIEAHGIGTPISDVNELKSIAKIYDKGRDRRNHPLYIATVKTNIGYLEYACGIASLIKVVLSLKNKKIPAHLHLKEIHPEASVDKSSAIVFPAKCTEWLKADKKPRRAGINGYSLGGTNAHMILEEYPEVSFQDNPALTRFILTISAKTPEALDQYLIDYQAALSKKSKTSLQQFCYSANTSRSHFQYRLAFLVNDWEQLSDALFKARKITEVTKGLLPKITLFLPDDCGNELHLAINFSKKSSYFKTLIRQSIFEIINDSKSRSSKTLDEKKLLAQLTPDELHCVFQYSLANLLIYWGVKPHKILAEGRGLITKALLSKKISLGDIKQSLDLSRKENNKRMKALKENSVIITLGNVSSEEEINSNELWDRILGKLIEIYCLGGTINWMNFHHDDLVKPKTPVPMYPFNKERLVWFNH
jgi:acyl transferase domain-containing protein